MRETLLLYTSIKEPVDALTDDQAGKLLKALLAYQAGEDVALDGLLNVVFLQIRQQIDRNNEKYEEAQRKRSEAGKKGMASRWASKNNNDNTVITNDNNVINVIADYNKNNLYDNDNVNVNVNNKKKVYSNEYTKEVVELWNSYDQRGLIQRINFITAGSTREKLLRARVDAVGLDAVLAAVRNVFASSFLRGENDRGWAATFDWFLKPNNFVKVADGNYCDRPAQNTPTTSQKAQEAKKRGSAEELQSFYNNAVKWAEGG